MPGLCEVCSKEPSKYKCPTCGVSSCSLVCTKSHKTNCAPKQSPAEHEQQRQPEPEKPQVHSKEQENKPKGFSLADAQKLFAEYPGLRARLRQINKVTKEEDWNPAYLRMNHSRHHSKHHNNNRIVPWTAEKGFNRGVGKVRKWRESCESGESTGSDAEGFMKFIALVAGDHEDSAASKPLQEELASVRS